MMSLLRAFPQILFNCWFQPCSSLMVMNDVAKVTVDVLKNLWIKLEPSAVQAAIQAINILASHCLRSAKMLSARLKPAVELYLKDRKNSGMLEQI